MMKRLSIFTLLAVTALPVCADTDTLSLGRVVIETFWSNDTSTFWGQMSPNMKKVFGSEDNLASFRKQARLAFGAETKLLSERTRRLGTNELYVRRAQYTGASVPHRMVMEVALNCDGQIEMFRIYEQPGIDYKARTKLRLPFDDTWHVAWGGNTYAENRHMDSPDQRFALDLLIVQHGASYQGDPTVLKNYYCWDRPILSPSAGLVVRVVDGLKDQPIGKRDEKNPFGNHVVVDFGNGEYGFFAHLRSGSICIKKGTEVLEGDVLGHCGNSGNSSEPHLHFHLQTCPTPHYGQGLPAQFTRYMADGKLIENGEPIQGQLITPAH